MARIFIGYRRDDSAGHVGWLRDRLSQRFGADEIFRDIDTIPPGVDFVEAIEAARQDFERAAQLGDEDEKKKLAEF